MHVLVLGGYGLIGLEVCRNLQAQGYRVSALGRKAALGQRLLPQVAWLQADIAQLNDPADWQVLLAGVDVVINASGALQEGSRDQLARVQDSAIKALVRACEGSSCLRYIQISAPGANVAAGTAFLRTKGEADKTLMGSHLQWLVLRPGLVIAPNAYGGTMLLRLLAAVPVVQPVALPQSRIQTVAMADVTRAIMLALQDKVAWRQVYNLVEDEPSTLQEIVLLLRAWLGFAPPCRVLTVPMGMVVCCARMADAAGWLGWRSPLRSTALWVLQDGVLADPDPWRQASGQSCVPLARTLATMPATAQERLFARMQLVWPVAVVLAAVFWLASGLIGLAQAHAASLVLHDVMPPAWATLLVIGGAVADIAIGLGFLFRRTVQKAAWFSIMLALAYLAAGVVLTPGLLADPLGPLVKIIPVITMGLFIAILAEER